MYQARLVNSATVAAVLGTALVTISIETPSSLVLGAALVTGKRLRGQNEVAYAGDVGSTTATVISVAQPSYPLPLRTLTGLGLNCINGSTMHEIGKDPVSTIAAKSVGNLQAQPPSQLGRVYSATPLITAISCTGLAVVLPLTRHHVS